LRDDLTRTRIAIHRAFDRKVTYVTAGKAWNVAYWESELPDALSGITGAVNAAFGRDIVYVTATDPKFDFFN